MRENDTRESIDPRAMKTELSSVSESFCLVRWKHATINFASGASKSCCHHDFKSIPNETPSLQLHENEEEVKLRSQMLAGEKPKDCSYCWWVEENGQHSDRTRWSAQPWMKPFLKDIQKDLSPYAQSPSWLELNFSSVCNLKCVYCSPIFSTKWYKEVKEFGPYPTSEAFNNLDDLNHVEFEDNYENRELLNRFWPWFHRALPNLKLLKISGGEPLLSEQTFKVLELIKWAKNFQLDVGINSNCSVPEKNWDRFIRAVKDLEEESSLARIYLHPSLDTFSNRAEYIRTGLNLEAFKKNIDRYLEETSGSIVFICTLTNLALGGLKEYWEYVYAMKQKYAHEEREIVLGTEMLHSPSWLNLNLLPDSMVGYLDEIISFVQERRGPTNKDFSQDELDGLLKAQSALLSVPEDKERNISDLKVYLKELDRRRSTDFVSTFPELKEFLDAAPV